MTVLGKIKKQPIEERFYDIELVKDMLEGDSVSSVSASISCVTTPGDIALEVLSSIVSPTRVRVFMVGGTDQKRYKVTVTVMTVMGEKIQDEILADIKEL